MPKALIGSPFHMNAYLETEMWCLVIVSSLTAYLQIPTYW